MGFWQDLVSWLRRTAPVAPLPAPNTPAAELLAAHNQERKRAGLAPLKLQGTLQQAAEGHAAWMARHQRMTHDNGGTFLDRLSSYRGLRAGENIAQGQRIVSEVMAAWMASPPHRVNVLGVYTEVGFGMAAGEDGQLYWCVDFGLPFPANSLLGGDPVVFLSGPLSF